MSPVLYIAKTLHTTRPQRGNDSWRAARRSERPTRTFAATPFNMYSRSFH